MKTNFVLGGFLAGVLCFAAGCGASQARSAVPVGTTFVTSAEIAPVMAEPVRSIDTTDPWRSIDTTDPWSETAAEETASESETTGAPRTWGAAPSKR